MIDDALKALIIDFADESDAILNDVQESIEAIENGERDSAGFAEFAQKIDRIMGCAGSFKMFNTAAMTPALNVITHLATGCKELGYKSTQLKQPETIVIAAGFLAEAVEIIQNAVADLRKGYISLDANTTKNVAQRLGWLCTKLKMSPEEERALRKSFGL